MEVVRDTVGRHDTFGLACTAKYYEDMGYFGHVNCSDNFNAQLLPYTIEPRKGWPAINFFFNTAFDAHNQYVVDEPWSRPGDYLPGSVLTFSEASICNNESFEARKHLLDEAVGSVVERGLNLPDAASLIRGDTKLNAPPKAPPPVATTRVGLHPSTRARAWISNWSRRSAKRIWPNDGNFVPGPIEPATKRSSPAARRAIWAAKNWCLRLTAFLNRSARLG